ncbi:alanine racemase [Tessaracoccus sp. MC1679]|uniref:alanine racemase n=1 Tax=unclassified Tessaracoccus TaxID=2635419 RepID=UPI001601575D|nr:MULTISPECIES: alanine racemase [unclassified Tessaracoccus]MBB1511362.1 alanine racemase [Tessaracoccus sp. MC1627]MBB1514934.1 alanine racemase [Tessaracoccus sp. MC1679]
MTLTLTIDRSRWQAHQRAILEDAPGLVPVAKGNGYGFGLRLLASESARLGVKTIAVGIAQEVPAVRAGGFDGDIVVLSPWRPFDDAATALLHDPKVITTVSRAEDLRALASAHPGVRVIVEIETSMHRHGLDPRTLTEQDFGPLTFEGWTIHLPANGSLDEAKRLAGAGLGVRRGPVWVSHLSVTDYRVLRTALGVRTHLRVGTRLWLGDKRAYATTATVLDVHRITSGSPLGYHGVKAPGNGWLVIVSGGTAHGVAMSAPTPQRSLRQRGVTVAQGVLDALGRSLSPFTIGGRKRAFAEPPHMHSSMVFVPGSDAPAQVGDEVPVTTRMTTVTVDEIRQV